MEEHMEMKLFWFSRSSILSTLTKNKFGESQKHSDRAYFLNLSFIFSICHLSFISQFVIYFFLFSQFVIFVISFFFFYLSFLSQSFVPLTRLTMWLKMLQLHNEYLPFLLDCQYKLSNTRLAPRFSTYFSAFLYAGINKDAFSVHREWGCTRVGDHATLVGCS
jgi:hypothetical protein